MKLILRNNKEEDVIITLTKQGYIKRIPSDTYKVQNRGGKGIVALTTKEDDYVDSLFVTSTHNEILFFTNKGRVYKLKAYEIPEGKRQENRSKYHKSVGTYARRKSKCRYSYKRNS